MDFESILQQVLNVAGTFNLKLVVFLFLICAIGEFHVSMPYLLETIWLLSGYHAGSSVISPIDLLLLWLVAQGGRQTGAIGLFYFSRLGSSPITRLYQRYAGSLSRKPVASNSLLMKAWQRLGQLSPFSIALARLFWLRLPLTLALGVQKRLRPLSLGIILSSVVWDGIYISLGVLGGHVMLKPVQMVLYSLIGLTVLYILTFVVRQMRLRKAQ